MEKKGVSMPKSVSLITLVTLVLGWAASTWAGPFSSKPAEIEKVKYTHLQLSKSVKTQDPMINFERDYLLHGAITTEEYRARQGKYYTVFWKVKDRSPGLVIRFEYLQANTQDTIKVKEITPDKIKRSNITDIRVIGEEYNTDGNVLAWKVSLVRNGEVLDSVESYLWE